ncbi:MAG: sugar ABC transporter ATP-binding protein [Saprospiraceae bacterium]|nr:sugar ABC transporter ATP-binding protein [Saprospiraceae bacterium]
MSTVNEHKSGLKLELSGISKSFPGVKVLSGVNLTFYPGKVNALMGENGAGKSTLLKILTGIYSDYEGQIFMDDKAVTFTSLKDAKLAGIAMIHQELSLITQLTVSENLFLGQEINDAWSLPNKKKMGEVAQALLDKLGLKFSVDTLVSQLSVGEQQMLEIARVLLTDARIILMDEPTSALSDKEILRLHEVIRQLTIEGKTIVYISHKMDELFRIADNYVVLRDGVVTGQGKMTEISEEALIRMMVGRDIVVNKKINSSAQSQSALIVNNLFMAHPTIKGKLRLDHINLEVKKGEIVGIFGLMGAGRSELLHCIFGAYKSSASIAINGKSVVIKSPREAIANGLAFVTEDRKEEGLVLDLPLTSNINLTKSDGSWVVNEAKELALSNDFIQKLGIKTPSAQQLCKNLSGGNQQKVVLSKWLATEPDVLMLDEPTRGIDLNAKNDIYELIKSLADSGMSILMASSEIPELLAICDRILVMSEGKITASFSADEANEDKLLKAAI